MRDRILPVEDEDVANTLFEMLCNEDVDIRLRTRVRQVGRKGDGNIKLRIASDSDHVQAITGSHMLVAGQRRPNTNHLNLEKAGIQTDAAGFIVTNENLQTNVPQIYALGDVRGGLAYQHVAYDDYRVLRTNLVDNSDATIENRLFPCVIFTDPELGRVGLTEHDARQRGMRGRQTWPDRPWSAIFSMTWAVSVARRWKPGPRAMRLSSM